MYFFLIKCSIWSLKNSYTYIHIHIHIQVNSYKDTKQNVKRGFRLSKLGFILAENNLSVFSQLCGPLIKLGFGDYLINLNYPVLFFLREGAFMKNLKGK